MGSIYAPPGSLGLTLIGLGAKRPTAFKNASYSEKFPHNPYINPHVNSLLFTYFDVQT